MHRRSLALVALGLGLLAPLGAGAHFVLTSPPSSFQLDAIGDPQKAPPCGDDGSAVASGMITNVQAGDTIMVTIDEMIFHPGHYRISLAPNDPSELPAEPIVTPDNNSPCGSAPIDPAPVFPVLADGVFQHTEPFAAAQSIEITIPADVTCDNCTLQIIQFMSNHGLNNPGGCYYHHCAALSVQAGPVDDTSGGGEASSGGGGDESTSENGEVGPESTDPSTTADGSASQEDSGSAMDDTTAAATSATGFSEGGSGSDADESDSGCGCVQSGRERSAAGAMIALLFGLVARPRRARRGAI